MISLNKAQLIGFLGSEPDIHELASGKKMAKFAVATNEVWKDKEGEKRERTDWHKVVILHDALADFCEKYLHKGSKVYIEGRLSTQWYKDANDIEKSSTSIFVSGINSRIICLSDKNKTNENEIDGSHIQEVIDANIIVDNDFSEAYPF